MYLLVIAILLFIILYLLYRLRRQSSFIKAITHFLNEMSSGNPDIHLSGKRNLDEITMNILSIIKETYSRLFLVEDELKRMERVLRNMSDSLLITDTNGTIILANNAFRTLFSLDDPIERRPIIEVVRNMVLIEIINNAVESKEPISDEITISISRKDIHLIATAVPLYSEDSVSGVVLTLHDITRLRQLEEMRKDFVANVSHEIKTPITAIKGFSETLLDGAINDRENAIRFLGMIKHHSERLNSLVDDLLTLSRIELGDIRIAKTEVNIDQLIDNVFMTLKDKADKKGIYLIKDIPEENRIIHADRDRLIQIILNLVDNGIKFTDKGGVTVALEKRNNGLILFVKDTGIGIPEGHIKRLGERFYRVDRTRSRELGGTGLGLAIVKHLVMAHRWSIEINSTPGKGTTVKILII